MKESQLKQLVKAVLTQLHENSNPEAWRRTEFPSGEPPEPMDAQDSPEPEEPLADRIASLEDTLKKLEIQDQQTDTGTEASQQIYIKMMKVLESLIDLYAQQEHGVSESFGMTHDTVSPQDANTMNKSTIKEVNVNDVASIGQFLATIPVDVLAKGLLVGVSSTVLYRLIKDLVVGIKKK